MGQTALTTLRRATDEIRKMGYRPLFVKNTPTIHFSMYLDKKVANLMLDQLENRLGEEFKINRRFLKGSGLYDIEITIA